MIKKKFSSITSTRKTAWLTLASAALVSLAGCSQVPTYERPAAPVPQHFPNVSEAPATPLMPWREYFSDPSLRTLIEAALNHNRDLKIAVARVEEARALAGVTRADRFPTLEAQGSFNRSRTPANVSVTGNARTFSRYDLALGLTAFELDFWGRVAALSEAARSQYLATEEAARSFRIGLISDVASTWLMRVQLAEQERLATETLKTREESLTLIRKRQGAGLASDLDVLAAEGLAESVRVQTGDLKRQRMQAENALRLLTGMEVDIPAPANSASQSLMDGLAPGLPSEVLLHRPDVLAAEQRLIAANANIGAARAAFFPRIALTTNLGMASSALSTLFGSGSEAWVFQPVLRLPLFDAGRNKANLDVANARKVQAVADYEKTIQQAFREVSDVLAAQSTYTEQVTAQEANVRAQQTRFERVKAREKAGIATYLEILDASRDAFNAEQVFVSYRWQLMSTRIALYKALGGEGCARHKLTCNAEFSNP